MHRALLACGLVVTVLSASVTGQVDERTKGIELYRDGNYAEAINVLQKVVDADPTNKIAWTYLGGALVNTGKMKEALTAFRKPFGGPKSDEKFDTELKITKRQHAGYTPAARSNGISGTVFLMVEFKADGTIGFVVPIQTLMFGLTENSVKAAKSTRFDPAMKDDKPVSVIRMLSYSFNIYQRCENLWSACNSAIYCFRIARPTPPSFEASGVASAADVRSIELCDVREFAVARTLLPSDEYQHLFCEDCLGAFFRPAEFVARQSDPDL